MRLTFRPVRPGEISEASHLVDAAYAPQLHKLYGDTPRGHWRHYDEAKIESYISREAQGVRAGVWRDRLITLNICCSYGSFGWFHTLAVHPDYQRKGLGKLAVRDAEHYLSQQGVASIGMMTWPMAVNNLAFYQRQDYRLAGLSVYAYRDVAIPMMIGRSPFHAQLYDSIKESERNRVQQAIRNMCQQVSSGLDYVPWVDWARSQSFAETLLLWKDHSLRAFAIAYFFPNAHWADGKLLLLSPSLSRDETLWVLEHLLHWARSRQRTLLGLSVDLTTPFARNFLLPNHFSLHPEAMVNLVKGHDLPDSNHHLTRFGG